MMFSCVVAALLVFLNISESSGADVIKKGPFKLGNETCSYNLELTVFFEAGCPDSNHFFSSVLRPQYQSFSPVLSLDLIPWGNAKSFNLGYGQYAFASQHGMQEVRSNMFMACAYNLLTNEAYVDLVTCMMGTGGSIQATYDSWLYCSTVNRIDYDMIYSCYSGEDGGIDLVNMELMAEFNRHTFIPWLELNKNSNSTVQSMGLDPSGFVQLLCAELCEPVRPSICTQ